MVLLNRDQIKELIPHRDPFLLIDEITALDPGRKCTAVKYIKDEDFWFQGHFPDNPVTPGVLMVEMLAQATAVCAGALAENKGRTGLFARIDKAKFKRIVQPGDTLTLDVEILRIRKGICTAKGTATVEGDVAVTAELTFAYQK